MTPSIEALLAHAGWVRALAHTLVNDPHDADDLAQETLTAALVSQPRPGRGFAGWLATTLRNAKSQRWRREVVRERLEWTGARDEHLPSTDELAEQADLQRALVEHVLALDEPYRGVLLQRYFAELDPAEIAERAHVPLKTVSSQITRAHQKLRERLERKHGGGRAWLSAVVPLLPRGHTLSTAGGALLNAKIIMSVAAVVIVTGVLVWTRADGPAASTPTTLARGIEASRSESPKGDVPPLQVDAGAASERTALDRAPSATTKSAAATPPESFVVHGSVLDSDGHPTAGLLVGWSGSGAERIASAAQGRFDLNTTATQGTIDAFEPGWTTVRSGAWRKNAKVEPTVIVARSLDLAGIVQGEHGEPLPGARVMLATPSDFETRFEGNLEATSSNGWRSISDARGHFSLEHAPSISGAMLRTVLEGYEMSEMAEPLVRDQALVIVMQRPKIALAGALRGRVVDDHGTPVAMARVFLGLASTTTDEAGRFGIPLARAVTSDRISALKSGFRPAVLDRPRPPHGDETGWPESIELQFPGPSLSIRGVVVDRDDHPRAGLRVSLDTPTPVGAIGKMPAFAENLMAGARVPPLALQSEARAPKADADDFWDFQMHDVEPSAFWNWVPTDEQGRFELTGLDDRSYRLRLMDPKSLDITTTDAYPAGETVRIVMPAPNFIPRVAGRVIDDDGKPIAGVSVSLSGEAVGVRSRVFGGRVDVQIREPREGVRTDEKGRFEFKDVPRANIHLSFTSDEILPDELEIAKLSKPDAIEMKVHTRCSLQVVITTHGLDADRVAIRGPNDEGLDLYTLESGSVNAFTDAPIVDGHTSVLSASSAAAVLVLFKGDEVVKRTNIRLHTDGINRIEL